MHWMQKTLSALALAAPAALVAGGAAAGESGDPSQAGSPEVILVGWGPGNGHGHAFGNRPDSNNYGCCTPPKFVPPDWARGNGWGPDNGHGIENGPHNCACAPLNIGPDWGSPIVIGH